MEPLSAIALAGNILQFVEKGAYLISSSRELSILGATKEHVELRTIAQELQGLVSRAPPMSKGVKSSSLDDDEKAIRALGEQCNQVAQELLRVLDSLEVKSKDSSLGQAESVYKALLSEWKKPKIDALQVRLDRIGTNIQAHIASYDLGKVLARLYELESQNRFFQAQRKDEIEDLREHMKEIFDGIGTKLQKQGSRDRTITALLGAAASGSQYAAEQLVLANLWFEEIQYRYDNIRNAHGQTLSWLFSTTEQHSPVTFDEWLCSEDNQYWISGKPGSGKSTLMKFLSHSPRTTAHLRSWAKQKRLIYAVYFFWSSGKSIQKSLDGLLRSLLFDILRQIPHIIPSVYPSVYPHIWKLVSPNTNNSTAETTAVTVPLSVPGLLESLKVAIAIAANSDTKFCFFIDGLDEYEGQPNDMIEFISLLKDLPNIKLCVSSRPWNEFEREFGKNGSRKLYMQDFNGADIRNYVNHTLDNDENFQELEDKEVNGKPLVEEIVQAANGVFLWVFLVVRSFQEGLNNGDSALDLRRRLSQLPSISTKFYHGHSAEMFTVTLEGQEEIPLTAYWFLREDEEDVLRLETRPLSIQEVNKRIRDTTKRLNASCKGLLEVRVVFLHRTVRDYLTLDETRALLQSCFDDDLSADAGTQRLDSSREKTDKPGSTPNLLRRIRHRLRVALQDK
ncbi:hypothetical protein BDV96DRAFT_626020 [Lophiotrema nucula]|uniref:Uncharacterized protein n=1 Tax=Lophiotrema nucula TaxID=690887 RepID=A0A6A5YIH5_9PLEO|nr:hypothetical protein BDV96DRAFT_626020 [Lophiotrema nucula]